MIVNIIINIYINANGFGSPLVANRTRYFLPFLINIMNSIIIAIINSTTNNNTANGFSLNQRRIPKESPDKSHRNPIGIP